ncbi:hypothetical protein V8C86DRAFT_2458494 [Haematococcus lacustris]
MHLLTLPRLLHRRLLRQLLHLHLASPALLQQLRRFPATLWLMPLIMRPGSSIMHSSNTMLGLMEPTRSSTWQQLQLRVTWLPQVMTICPTWLPPTSIQLPL